MRLSKPRRGEPFDLLTRLHHYHGKPLSMREYARRTGLHFSHVARLLRGERKPSIAQLVQLAAAIGLELVITIKRKRRIPR